MIEKMCEILELFGDGVVKFFKGDFCVFFVCGVLFCLFYGDMDGL